MNMSAAPCPFRADFARDLHLAMRIADRLYTEPPSSEGALLVCTLVFTDLVVVPGELAGVLEALRTQWGNGMVLDHIDIRLQDHGLRRVRFGLFTQALLARLSRIPVLEQALDEFLAWVAHHIEPGLHTARNTAVERVLRTAQARVRWSLPGGAADRVMLLTNGRTPAPAGYRAQMRTIARYDNDVPPSVARLSEIQRVISDAEKRGSGDAAGRRKVGETVAVWSDLTELEELVRALAMKWVSEQKDPHSIVAYASIAKPMFRFLEERGACIADVSSLSWLDYFQSVPRDDRQLSKRSAVLNDIQDLVGKLDQSGRSRREPIGYVRTIDLNDVPQVEALISAQIHLPKVVVAMAVELLHTKLRYALRSDELITRTSASLLRRRDDLIAVRRSRTFSAKSFASYRLVGPAGAQLTPSLIQPAVFVNDGHDDDTIAQAMQLLAWSLGQFGAVVHGLRTRALSESLGRAFLPGVDRDALDDARLLNAEAEVATFAGHAGPGIVSRWYYDLQDRERRAWADQIIVEDLERLRGRGFVQGCDSLIAQVAGVTSEAVRQRRSRLRVRHIELLMTFVRPDAHSQTVATRIDASAPNSASNDTQLVRGLAYLAARLGDVDVVEASHVSRVSGELQRRFERAVQLGRLSKCNFALGRRKRESLLALAEATLPLLRALPEQPVPEHAAAISSALTKSGTMSVLDLDHLSALPPLSGLLPHVRVTVSYDPERFTLDALYRACRPLGAVEPLAAPGADLALRCEWRAPSKASGVVATRAFYLACVAWWSLRTLGDSHE